MINSEILSFSELFFLSLLSLSLSLSLFLSLFLSLSLSLSPSLSLSLFLYIYICVGVCVCFCVKTIYIYICVCVCVCVSVCVCVCVLAVLLLQYVLRTSIDKIKENAFELTKKRSRRYPAKTISDADNADDIALKALASMSMHKKWNTCALIKLATSPH